MAAAEFMATFSSARDSRLRMPRQIGYGSLAGSKHQHREGNVTDRYTKIVLTIIAAALVGLVIQNVVPMARAQSEACGSAKNPCWVAAAPRQPLYVAVNPKDPLYISNVPFQPLLVEIKREFSLKPN
jgi:hypothetical protein